MRIAAGPASGSERRRAAAMVAALLRTATRAVKAKREQARRTAVATFHRRMARALAFYRLHKARRRRPARYSEMQGEIQ